MKKTILLVLGIILSSVFTSVNAEVLAHKLYAISNHNVPNENLTKNATIGFQTLDTYKISDEDYIEAFATVNFRIDKKVKAKRGKRDEYLKVTLLSYTIPSKDGKKVNVEKEDIEGTIKVSEEKDYKEIIKSVGLGVAGHALSVPLLSQAVAVSKGLINPNEDQSRLESAGKNLYNSTPLPYVEKGKDISIKENTIVLIKLKSMLSDDNIYEK